MGSTKSVDDSGRSPGWEGSAVKPLIAAAASTQAREGELVALAKAGSSDAFATLFRRYRERITLYVRTFVPEHGRAEDIVQEIFVSAFRKLDTLDDPAAFKSWIYEIARNASLDDLRRVKRNGEVFVRSDDFEPYDDNRTRQAQTIHGAVSWKQELVHLREALGGLPQTQHEALVLREFGGMTYEEIGAKMNLSQPAVQSILFRARRVLKDEYSEISTGERCRRMQATMGKVAEGLGGMRERRLLVRHVRDCAVCRRQATQMGFAGLALEDPKGRLRRAASRAAAFIPFPFFFNRRGEDSEHFAGGGSSFGAQAQGFAAQWSTAGSMGADHAASAIHKAAAVVAAVAVIGGGAGVAVKGSGVRLPVLGTAKSSSAHSSDAAQGNSGKAINGELGSAGQAPPPTDGSKAAAAGGSHDGGLPLGTGPLGVTPAGTPADAGLAPPAGMDLMAPDAGGLPVPVPTTDVPADGGGPSASAPSDGSGSDASTTPALASDPAPASDPSQPPADPPPDNPPADQGPPPSDSAAPLPGDGDISPGMVKQIQSGKRTLGDLPRGQARKLRNAPAA
jgi:RNA polymerase sigma factor (sigma-70 family)